MFSLKAFAGDIPESIMLGEQQALFIGEIVAENEDTYTLSPLDILMGEVEKDINVEKFNYYGTTDSPKIGDYLVVVLIEDNKINDTWVFKATTSDYRTLRLVSEKHNMVKRYEQYINEGSYQKAQRDLDNKDTFIEKGLTESEDNIVQVSNTPIFNSSNFAILGFSVILLAVLIYVYVLRKTR